ncbi:alpha/beta fold hydrolase [Varunaivibrio sulfuroxidans]|uniref:Esterase/lipase n=1 Tax=Varunaivibrio sulfuroxidans TaxID=1773489 RepID=A0A4R3J6J6_9PROT|nr:alpha/beta fold hydrolase [Varunaivibrio sulfuroxidans]TCS60992.1 esterase/lipase [Varunaivibrio sulfuroxidans]WES31602.1 alpha/beta fold hydrolase [Varunaivibrio sulfuroxidans]
MVDLEAYRINTSVYEWCVGAFSRLERHLGLKIKLHSSPELLAQGQIFLFNHFARFETVIPPYLVYKHSGRYCRSVADHTLFEGSEMFAKFLRGVGGVPNTTAGLMPFLAAEILRGRKIVVFPEGGMIKDRRVLDKRGAYNVYSPVAQERRKHHRGAAVIALTLDTFKNRILSVHAHAEEERLHRWVDALGLESVDQLLERAREPTMIVPANITFYPLRVTENILHRGMELLMKDMSGRFSEELLIEGNILLKDTDMDIRFAPPVMAAKKWRWWERVLLKSVFERIDSLEELFAMRDGAVGWAEKMMNRCIQDETMRIRDAYMAGMYSVTTVNFSHLASRLIVDLVAAGRREIGKEEFHKALYLAIKNLQNAEGVGLHRSLLAPESYRGLLDGQCDALEQFLRTTKQAGLIGRTPSKYRFLDSLSADSTFDRIRIDNPIMVYANEVAPIAAVRATLNDALERAGRVLDEELASDQFDDELRAHQWNHAHYRGERHHEINAKETATLSGEPFLLIPKEITAVGVVLVHGFLASPAEMRAFGEKLVQKGHPVIGVRLAGHGTSPWDLQHRSWREWLQSVRRGCAILGAFCEKIAVVGFSGGGVLALRLASEAPRSLVGVAVVSAPMRFLDRRMAFVPLVHRLNTLTEWLPSFDGVMPFHENASEHPEINYKNIPTRGVYELRQLVEETRHVLPTVRCPALIVQGDRDPVVDPESATLIHDRLGSSQKTLVYVPSTRHAILLEDIAGAQDRVANFLKGLPWEADDSGTS